MALLSIGPVTQAQRIQLGLLIWSIGKVNNCSKLSTGYLGVNLDF